MKQGVSPLPPPASNTDAKKGRSLEPSFLFASINLYELAARLTLGKLRRFAGLVQTVFLSFRHTRVTG